MAGKILTIVRKPPYGLEDAFAGLRLSMAMVASGALEDTATVLMGEGVLNAVKTQDSSAVGMPSNLDPVDDLSALDSPVYCVREDLAELGLAEDILVEGITLIGKSELPGLVDSFDVVTTF